MEQTVGLIGLGIMGSAMSANLLRAGFSVAGYDIMEARRRDFRKAGGTPLRNCRDMARTAGVFVTSLPTSEALLNVAEELSRSARRGQILVETSTLPIPVKETARKRLSKRGAILLDCPLSGTGAQARAKDLVVYASGDRKAYARVTSILEGFARAHFYLGAFGAGSKMKFVANLLVAIHNVAAAEALVLAKKSGLDPAKALEVAAAGAGNSRMLELRGPMMVRGDYSKATMKVQVWQKDMTIIGDFARKLACPTPLFDASASFYTAAMAAGRNDEDTASVCAVIEQLAYASSEKAGIKRARPRK